MLCGFESWREQLGKEKDIQNLRYMKALDDGGLLEVPE